MTATKKKRTGSILTKEIERQAICIENDIDKVFQSVHHVTFILCYTVLYDFLGLRFATVGAKRTSTGCPAPLYLPLSEFVNTDGTI